MPSFPPSFFDGLANWLELAVYDINQEHRMVRRRLVEPAFIDGAMRQPGYIFDDLSAGPHRRTHDQSFAYHPQFEEYTALMSVIDRIKAKALEARQIAPNAIKEFEADLDALIAEGPKLKAEGAEAVSMHQDAFKGIRGEFDGLKSAIDILSNGAPSDPLPASGEEHKG